MAGRARTIRDLLALAVAVTLVGAVVVGAVGSDRSADAAATTTHRVTIPAAAFIPVSDAQAYQNNGSDLAGSGFFFVAPVSFYRPGDKVRVMNMTLFATDNHAEMVCVDLRVLNAARGVGQTKGQVCSTGADPDARSFQVRFPPPRAITEFQGAFAFLNIGAEAPNDLRFHALRITYRVTE